LYPSGSTHIRGIPHGKVQVGAREKQTKHGGFV
jgi:hypothetical protein